MHLFRVISITTFLLQNHILCSTSDKLTPTVQESYYIEDSHLQNRLDQQTKQLFYHIAGVNTEDISDHFRITRLFLQSVRLTSMICDPLYLPEEFLDTVETGFMFLLKQQSLEQLEDIDLDDFEMLRQALEFCMGDPNATVVIEGNHCPSNFHVLLFLKR